ncbi:MAG: response regulator transcription factor [Selenomonadales bacterium]|nr:response regulator transcription factor [Selenomonadales bacterium]
MKLVVVDDDPLVCQSLKTILEANPECSVVGVGHDGNEAVALFAQHLPDVLLMDIRMHPQNGLEAASLILTAHPEAKILFLTTFADTEYLVQALRIGAKGYMLKQHVESIVPALKAVCLGQRVFGDEIVTKLPPLLPENNKGGFQDGRLTGKEADILRCLALGMSNREIAATLFLSEGTVRNYISVMLEKLALRDRTQLAIFYYKHM